DQVATAEVAGRKSRLGSGAISVDKYPRIVFGVEVSLDRVLTLGKRSLPKVLHGLIAPWLDKDSRSASMDLGRELEKQSIQALRFPSVTGRGSNLIVYNRNCGPSSLALVNLP